VLPQVDESHSGLVRLSRVPSAGLLRAKELLRTEPTPRIHIKPPAATLSHQNRPEQGGARLSKRLGSGARRPRRLLVLRRRLDWLRALALTRPALSLRRSRPGAPSRRLVVGERATRPPGSEPAGARGSRLRHSTASRARRRLAKALGKGWLCVSKPVFSSFSSPFSCR
jgi:hypothetical protein